MYNTYVHTYIHTIQYNVRRKLCSCVMQLAHYWVQPAGVRVEMHAWGVIPGPPHIVVTPYIAYICMYMHVCHMATYI